MREFINIGLFDTPVTYLQPTRTKNTFSQVEESFNPYGSPALCQVSRAGGEETTSAIKQDSPEFYEITGHYIPGINTTFRLEIDGEKYHILRRDIVGRRQYMKLKISKITE